MIDNGLETNSSLSRNLPSCEGCCPKSIPKVRQPDVSSWAGWPLSIGLTMVYHVSFLCYCNALQTLICQATSLWFAPACGSPVILWRCSSVSFGNETSISMMALPMFLYRYLTMLQRANCNNIWLHLSRATFIQVKHIFK